MNIKAGQVEFTVSNQQAMELGGQWAGLSMRQGGRDAMTMGPMTIQADIQAINQTNTGMYGLFTGTSSITMSELLINGGSPMEAMTIKNISMSSDNSIIDDAMSVKVNMGVESLDFFGMVFSDFVFNQELNSLDVPALLEINTLANKISTGQMTEEEIKVLEDAVMKILAGQPEVVISALGLTTQQGAITSNARIGVNPQLIDAKNPLTLLSALEVNAKGAIPEAFLTTMGMMPLVDPYVKQGFLEVESGEVLFDLVFEGGQMFLFGKPFSWSGAISQ